MRFRLRGARYELSSPFPHRPNPREVNSATIVILSGRFPPEMASANLNRKKPRNRDAMGAQRLCSAGVSARKLRGRQRKEKEESGERGKSRGMNDGAGNRN